MTTNAQVEMMGQQIEFNYARQIEIPIYPVLARGDVQDAVPLRLTIMQFTDIRSEYSQVETQLVPTLRQHVETTTEDNSESASLTTESDRKDSLGHLVEPSPQEDDKDTANKLAEPKNFIQFEWVSIPAGEFLMGSDPNKDQDAQDNEQPQHTLYLPDYYMAKTPVTNAQYAAFVEATGHRQPERWKQGKIPKGKEDHPVLWVSWRDSVAYCQWLAETTGKPYRLPTEAEWEKAARGPDGHIYPWGDESPNESLLNFNGNVGDTTPVGSYPDGVSPYGAYDMAGNAWEWCATKWGKSYPYDVQEDEWTAEYLEGTNIRVVRGGSFVDGQYSARCARRYRYYPDYRLLHYGFRVVVSPISLPSAP